MATIHEMKPEALSMSRLQERICDMRSVLILGIDSDGADFYGIAGMTTAGALYMMEKCKHFLMKLED